MGVKGMNPKSPHSNCCASQSLQLGRDLSPPFLFFLSSPVSGNSVCFFCLKGFVQPVKLWRGVGTPLLDLIWIAVAIKIYRTARLWHAQGTRVRACQELLLAHAEHNDRPNCWLRGYFSVSCNIFYLFVYLFGNLRFFYSDGVRQGRFPKDT